MTQPMTHEERQARDHEERRRRLLNDGIPEDRIEEEIARRDWEALPAEKKINRLKESVERLEALLGAALRDLSRDQRGLFHNDQALSDALDANFRAVEKLLVRAGLPLDVQQEIYAETRKELEEEFRVREESRAKSEAEEASQVDVPGAPPPPPDGATVFGG